MAVPKRKTSKAKRDSRRASAQILKKATVVTCPQCNEPKMPHRVCGECGYYKGEEVVSVD